MAIAGTPEELAAALTPYIGIGFDMFLLMERSPLDHETLRLFMQEVAPRLRTSANQFPLLQGAGDWFYRSYALVTIWRPTKLEEQAIMPSREYL